MKLFEIDDAIRNFELEIDEETGEVLNADALDDLKLAREQKIEGVALWVKELAAEAEAIKKEKDNMAKRQKVVENKVESLKGWLTYALQGEKFSTPRVAMTFRKSKSVNILDDALIDDKYCNLSVVKKPDKAAIKQVLEEGKEVKGAELITKRSIQIK